MRIAATVGAALVFALPAHAQQQIATSEPLEAVLVARDGRGQSSTMPLVDERLAVTIDEQHATTVLTQTYENRTGRQVEGTYRLRPGGAARVEGFAYWNGEQKIVGEVFEREAAREVYRRVTQRRRDPGLLEQTGDGAFTFQIFPIQPNEQKRVELRYTQWLSRRARRVEYRAPIANPRADIAVTITSRHPLRQVSSSSHAIRVEDLPGGQGVRIRVTGPRGASGSAPDVLALRWEVADAPWTPSVFIHRDSGHDGYFAFSLAAPDVPDDQIAAKDVTIVIDRSGSMAGTPIQQARRAAADVIRKLGRDDHVNVIAFDSDADPLFARPLPIARVRDEAIGFVDRLRDGGGTDIARALVVALRAQNDGERPRVVLFLTDGQSNTQSALAAATADQRDVRVFTVGLGAGVNRPLLSRLAALKRGRFTYIEDTTTIEDRVSQVYRHISRPLLVDLSLDVADGPSGGPGVSIARAYPRTLPDLFDGDELVVTGRVRGAGPAAFTLRGTLDGKPVAYQAVVAVSEAMRRPWVGRLWARARVDDLLEEIALHGETDELETEVIELALAYNFTTRYTAFLAIPADEITADAADALARARAKRQRAVERNADAAALNQPAGKVLARQVVASPAPPRDMSMDAGDDDDADVDADEYGESLSGASPAEIHRRGCAGCAAGGQGAGGAWLAFALAFALAAVTRRRRRPRRR